MNMHVRPLKIDINSIPSPLNRNINQAAKRIEDIILSLFIITLISPILLIITILIKCTSRGPVLFIQDRHGKDGKIIKVWKFRTMTVMENSHIITQATKNDPRITKVGRFLRRTSLDELPQFFNVLYGSMSIVGPRPHAVSHNHHYAELIPRYVLRHSVKPGVTGLAQIKGFRGETDTLDKMENRVRYDLVYIRIWSVWLDLKLVLLTLIYGFINKKAY